MADDVPITAGSGTSVATDDCTSGHAQVVKLAYSADGNRTHIPADADGLLVNLGTNNDVTVTSGAITATLAAGTNTNEVVGDAAHDAVAAGNPVLVGGYASAAAPTDVNADADAVRAWMLRNGATCVQLTAAGALIAGDATNGIDVDVTRLPALVASSANIGDVDVATVPAPLSTSGGGTEATALRVTLASDSTGLVSVDDNGASLTVDGTVNATAAGDVAHDSADSGNPVKLGAKADSSIKGATMVADLDRTDLIADVDGVLVVKHMCPQTDIINERVTDTGGTSTAFTNFSAVASTRNYVTTIVVYNSSATAGFLDLRDGTAGSVLMTIPLPAGGGAVVPLPVPLRQPTANTALAYDVSAALTTVYISLVGFQSKA